MDITELKKLIKNSSSVVIMENGEPSLVILSYQLYRSLFKDEKETEVKISSKVEREEEARTGAHSTLTPDEYNGHGFSGARNQVNSEQFLQADTSQSREAEILEKLNLEIMILKHQIEIEEQQSHQAAEIK